MKKFLLLLTLCLLLTGCTDPVRVEKANAIRRESEALYLATATAVATEREAAELDTKIRRLRADAAIEATATVTADREYLLAQTQPERLARKESVIAASTKALVAIVISACVAFCIVSIGGATAASRKANLEAQLIRIPKDTRVWPVLVQKDHILMLETGERFRITDVAPVHPGQLAISGQVRNVGLLAQSAEKIAKTTKNSQPADMLPGVAASVPILSVADSQVDVWPPPIPKHKWPRELREANSENETEGM